MLLITEVWHKFADLCANCNLQIVADSFQSESLAATRITLKLCGTKSQFQLNYLLQPIKIQYEAISGEQFKLSERNIKLWYLTATQIRRVLFASISRDVDTDSYIF